MTEGIGPIDNKMPVVNGLEASKKASLDSEPSFAAEDSATFSQNRESIRVDDIVEASQSLERIVNSVADTALNFSVDSDLSRVVVSVRMVGSDEIIRQFPPEEFLTVAKFIAAQDVNSLDQDFLKGILFDDHG